MAQIKFQVPGLLLCLIFAVLSYLIGQYIQVSVQLIALLIGVFMAFFISHKEQFDSGRKLVETKALGIAIALLGLKIPWQAIQNSGGKMLTMAMLGIAFSCLLTWLLAKWLKTDRAGSALIAVGSAICGSAAIMASQALVKASSSTTAICITLINLMGILGIFIAPSLALFFFEKQSDMGLFIGNTLQSMPHVIAAGYAAGDSAAEIAVVIKMIRILMLLPMLIIVTLIIGKRQDKASTGKSIPLFIQGFILFALIAKLQWLPENIITSLTWSGDLLMSMALFAIGLRVNRQAIQQSGSGLFSLSLLVFLGQLLFSYLLLILTANC